MGVSTCVSVPLGRRLCVAGAGDEGLGDLLEDVGLDLAPLRVGVPRGLLGLPETCSTVHIKERLLAMRRGADGGMGDERAEGRYLTTRSRAFQVSYIYIYIKWRKMGKFDDSYLFAGPHFSYIYF